MQLELKYDLTVLSLGADPEGFLRDPDGDIIPSIGLLGGSKEEPRVLEDGVMIQEDNVLLEFNIPPANNAVEFAVNITKAIGIVERIGVPEGHKPEFGIASHIFRENQMKRKKAWESGCDPDFDAWSGEIREPIKFAKQDNMYRRGAGGHIHVAYNTHPTDLRTADVDRLVVCMLDLYIGAPLLCLEPFTERRTGFGMYGAYRPKEYGIEWRAPSNFWLTLPEALVRDMAKAIIATVERMPNSPAISVVYRQAIHARNILGEVLARENTAGERLEEWNRIHTYLRKVMGPGMADVSRFHQQVTDRLKKEAAQP